MFNHHNETIKNVTDKLKKQEEVLAIILCGSIAHGFETERSDVDLMIVISEEDFVNRTKIGNIHYYETESCTYESGYIDGKYISLNFMNQVAEKGSEPARFAFEGAYTTYSTLEDIGKMMQRIVRYPVDKKEENITRFYAQFEAWKWYCEEAFKQNNLYLLGRSVSNFILFSGRLILAYNERLYPYHKWFLKVLEGSENKPEELINNIQSLLQTPTLEKITSLYNSIKGFRKWEGSDLDWPAVFMKDSELNWMDGNVPVEDI